MCLESLPIPWNGSTAMPLAQAILQAGSHQFMSNVHGGLRYAWGMTIVTVHHLAMTDAIMCTYVLNSALMAMGGGPAAQLPGAFERS